MWQSKVIPTNLAGAIPNVLCHEKKKNANPGLVHMGRRLYLVRATAGTGSDV
jgi:hypothetical protein